MFGNWNRSQTSRLASQQKEKVMHRHLPPIPPESVSPKGPGGAGKLEIRGDTQARIKAQRSGRNLAQEGRQGNIKQNTTNQGLQQDR